MGAYVSVHDCEKNYEIKLNCTINWTDDTNTTYDALGGVRKGQFEGDADIAGVGIFGSFVAVTGFALALSLLSVFIRMWKHRIFPFRGSVRDDINETIRRHSVKPSPADIVEAIVLSCSDVQIFTGAAYAITLRYFRGCTISAYHYNLVSNMMLLTCATHLMAITVVREYWRYPWLAVVRVICSLGIFLVTGLLLSNQNADLENAFPTRLPDYNARDSLMFLAAACFQARNSRLKETLTDSFDHMNDAVVFSTPGNHIEGWNKYLIIVLWFIASFLAEIAMFIRRGYGRNGIRQRLVKWFWRNLVRFSRAICCPVPSPGPGDESSTNVENSNAAKRIKHFGHYVLAVYSLGGIGICIWTVAIQATYMINLRQWVQRSEWLKKDEHGLDVENIPTSFGQLAPICLNALILFTFLQLWSSWFSNRKDNQRIRDLEGRHHTEQNSVSVTNSGDSVPIKVDQVVTASSVTPTPNIEQYMSSQQTTTYFQSPPPPPATAVPSPQQHQHQHQHQQFDFDTLPPPLEAPVTPSIQLPPRTELPSVTETPGTDAEKPETADERPQDDGDVSKIPADSPVSEGQRSVSRKPVRGLGGLFGETK